MARIRTIKPTFWSDEKIGLLPRAVRLTFLGLISAMADDYGRLVANPRIIRGAVYPFDDDVSAPEIAEHIDVLIGARRVARYQVNGDDYLYIRHWLRHQKVDRPSPSLLPPPPDIDDDSSNTSRIVDERSSNVRGSFPTERNGKEGNGEECNGKERIGTEGDSTGEQQPPPPNLAEDPPPTPRVVLPKGAVDFLGMFYEPAFTEKARKRYDNVQSQLYDALDPKHPGVPIRGGTRAHARGPAHLEECCRAVMREPPMDRDMAIVFLLRRLGWATKGPTASEAESTREKARMALENQYFEARRKAGLRWAKHHPEEYAAIERALELEMPRSGNDFMAEARKSALVSRCGEAAEFQSFDEWCTERKAS